MNTKYTEKRDKGYWVCGAILFYLSHRREVETYLRNAKAEFEAMQHTAHNADPMFYQKLADVHRAINTSHQ